MKRLLGIIITIAVLLTSTATFAEDVLEDGINDEEVVVEAVAEEEPADLEESEEEIELVTRDTVDFRFTVTQNGMETVENMRFYLFDIHGKFLQAKNCNINSSTEIAELSFEVDSYQSGEEFYLVPMYGMTSISTADVEYSHHTPVKVSTDAEDVIEFEVLPEYVIPEPEPEPVPETKQPPSVERVHDPEIEYQEKLAAIMNASGIDSKTDYLVWVSKQDYSVRVFLGSQGNWRYVTRFACSIGAPSTPTITGKFEYYAYQAIWKYDKYYCAPIMRFAPKGYAMHSTLIRYDGTPYDARLGMQISHGCVRLAPESIRWLVDYIPLHTRVYVTP